jgi:subtilisin family serine protease
MMNDPDRWPELGIPEDKTERGSYMVELNLLYPGGLEEAYKRFDKLFREVVQSAKPPVEISKTYYRCWMTFDEWHELCRRDSMDGEKNRAIYRLWPDFPIKPLIDRSVATIKADAARRSFDASGSGIIWAVVDSGIQKTHPHFQFFHTLKADEVKGLHRNFTVDEPSPEGALVDEYGHGTHVAGIIAGGLEDGPPDKVPYRVFEKIFKSLPNGNVVVERYGEREVAAAAALRGVAPRCRLISLKVMDDKGIGIASNVIRALRYVRVDINGEGKMLRVHGVNISVGYGFDAEMFACGQSPLCTEVDRLVRSGVVVVVAAGNTGYGTITADSKKLPVKATLSNSINDPGNSSLALTVGATHRDQPHTYGVSYFSSKGPTGDGRLKPDLVAPGERITSCAVGRNRTMIGAAAAGLPDGVAVYVDDSGTSVAAPHVSGAIAAFLSIRREFDQRPEDVKRIFLASATSLGRERYFEGNGLIDLMRAIQSV